MSITVSDPVEVSVSSRAEVAGDVDTPARREESWFKESLRSTLRARQMWLMSMAVWVLYVPHYSVIWLLGPRWGLKWVKVAARIHWLLTFFGAQRATRQRLASFAPLFECSESISEIMLKHLEMKHECFARVRVFNQQGVENRVGEVQWEVAPECQPALDSLEHRQRGLVIVGFHFGSYQMSTSAMSHVLPGCDPLQLRFRDAQCSELVASSVARIALRKAMEADRRSGANIFYVDGDTSVMQVLRLLRDGGCVAVASDGMLADDFLEVPFLDGMLRVPCGWARLTALTHADIVVVMDREIVDGRGILTFQNCIRCADRSAESVRAAVAQSIRILEENILARPWRWHPWQRLRSELGADGVPRYFLQQFRALPSGLSRSRKKLANAAHHDQTVARPAQAAAAPRQRRRAAIVCNSLTPYRVHLHKRLVEEVPEVELWSLATHGNAFGRWNGLQLPESIRPVNFGNGEPTNEQAKLRYSLREWRKGGRLIQWIKEHKISAVFCQGCGDVGRLRLLWWCRRNNVPCFLTGDFNICADRCQGLRRFIKRFVYGRAVRWSYGVMPCGILGKLLLDRYGGESKPFFAFPFVPDLSLFRAPPRAAMEAVQQRFDLSPNRRRIVFSARMMRVKRPDLALAAFTAIADERPDWDLIMLGDGELRAVMEARVPQRLRSRIRWLGFLNNREEVAGLYSLCDVLLLTSDHEPWGVVIVEAVAAGLAVVASDVVGAVPELVHDGRNGFVFPLADLPALIGTLRAITDETVLTQAKSQASTVLEEWRAEADPVDSFRAALKLCEFDSRPPATDGASETRRLPNSHMSLALAGNLAVGLTDLS